LHARDLGQEGLEGGSLDAGTRKAAVAEPILDEPPTLVCLALNIGLTGFPLGIKRVEILL
jgi:hypothetical protein